MCFQNTMVKQAQTDILIPKGRNRKEEEWHLKGQTALNFQAPENSFFGCVPVLVVWLWPLLLSSHGLASCACDSPRWQFCLCWSSLLELHPCSSLGCTLAALLVCTLSWPCILQSSLQGPNLWNLGEGSLAPWLSFCTQVTTEKVLQTLPKCTACSLCRGGHYVCPILRSSKPLLDWLGSCSRGREWSLPREVVLTGSAEVPWVPAASPLKPLGPLDSALWTCDRREPQ